MLKKLETAHPKIYDVILRVQGQDWLSKVINAVNPQKHNDAVRLGDKQMTIGPPGAPMIHLEETAAIHLKGGHQIITGDKVIEGMDVLTTATPLPAEYRDVVRVHEVVDEATFRAQWLDSLEVWNERMSQLIEDIYRPWPR
jgi:hypothetical protein